MDSLSTPCIFCGTDRPIASEVCPTCGRGWIDERIPQPTTAAQPETPAPTPSKASEPAPEDAHGADDAHPTVPEHAPDQPPAVPGPAPASTPPGSTPPEPPAPPPAATVSVAAAGAGLAFSSSDDTGLDDSAASEADATAHSDVPAVEAGSSGETTQQVPLADEEATSMFAAPGEPGRPSPAPTNADAAAPEAAAPASPRAADEPARPDETAPAAPPPTAASREPSAAEAPAPSDHGAAPESDGAEQDADPVDMTPAAPDELGIIPVVQAEGPPQYLPEPSNAEPQASSEDAENEPAGSAPPSDDDLPEFITPEPIAERPEQLGQVPIVTPPGSAEPPTAAAVAPDSAASAPTPQEGTSMASPPEHTGPSATPPGGTVDGAGSEEQAVDVPAVARDTTGGGELQPPADGEPPSPVSPATTPPAAPGGVIDPDRLIDDVFSDDLVDGRPPHATDEMLDDAGAWSAFAAGGAAAAHGADLTAEPESQPQEPPGAAPSSRPAPSEAVVGPAPTEPAPSGPPASGPPTAESLPPTAPLPVGETAATAVGGDFGGQHPDESDFFAPVPSDAPPPASQAGGAPPSRSRWSQTAIVAVIVLGIIGAWFVALALITNDPAEEAPVAGADSDAPVPQSTAGPETTVASTTSAPTTTLAPSTTVPAIEPVGDPIPLEELQLGAFALGPIEFGATDGLGRLVASLDQPDAIADAGSERGLCPDETGFIAQWGPMSAIFIGAPETNVLVGYQLGNDPSHPTSELTTLSGLQVGDTVADLESVYASFDISYEEIDGQLSFILVRQSDSATLLWGPVTSSEAGGIVEGIYAPRDCDAGPTPSG